MNSNTQDESIKHIRIIKCQLVEDTLVFWVLQKEHQKVCISQAIIQEKYHLFL